MESRRKSKHERGEDEVLTDHKAHLGPPELLSRAGWQTRQRRPPFDGARGMLALQAGAALHAHAPALRQSSEDEEGVEAEVIEGAHVQELHEEDMVKDIEKGRSHMDQVLTARLMRPIVHRANAGGGQHLGREGYDGQVCC